jgi:ribose/xylose/arabinose/galactoside ABC-type transport system permease subunit
MRTTTISDTATTSKKIDWSAFLSMLGPITGLVFVFLLFAILRPKTFLTVDNMQIMLLQTAVVGTAALGMTMIIYFRRN